MSWEVLLRERAEADLKEARDWYGFGADLYEVRTSVDGNTYRVLFCLDGSTMVLLHGFQKKSQKTPKTDLDLARRRMRDEEKNA